MNRSKARHPPCGLSALGIVSALGTGAGASWPRLLDGDSRLVQRDDLIRNRRVAFAQVLEDLPQIPKALAKYNNRTNQLALAALIQVQEAVERAISQFGKHRVGVVIGTTTGGMGEMDAAFRERRTTGVLPREFSMSHLEFGSAAEFVAEVSAACGPCYAVSTACSASAKALVSARRLLEMGVCDAVIAGGADSLCGMTANGFAALQALSNDVTNPMSRNRAGITLGEGAALFLVTRDPDAVQLRGVGESSDAHHISAPDPDGAGARRSMQGALHDAALSSGEVDYLNLHGTGTKHNDAMEARAVVASFGPAIPCSSTKPLVGHTLGAAGALELALCWLILTRSERGQLALPPHRWDGQADPDLEPLQLVESGARVTPRAAGTIASSSFGFGGSNCTVVLDAGGTR